jgi:hypothetical protein
MDRAPREIHEGPSSGTPANRKTISVFNRCNAAVFLVHMSGSHGATEHSIANPIGDHYQPINHKQQSA